MKLAWRHYAFALNGESRGYLLAGYSVFCALKGREDLELFHCDENGRLLDGSVIHNRSILHFCPPHMFRPFRGRTNILFSMWETDVIPPDILPAFEAADVRIVPSTYCQAVLKDHGLSSEVAPLGVAESLTAADASRRTIYLPGEGNRRRFLFVGSGSPRKGAGIISSAWSEAFAREAGDVQLYIKTIAADPEQRKVEEHFNGHVIVDTRDLSAVEMVELYQSADVFVCPSIAEAFGLPALEAMALGCLVIAPETGGLTEFVNGSTALVLGASGTQAFDYGATIVVKTPTVADLVPLLRAAYHEWGTPQLEAIRNNGIRVARGLTWKNTARRVAEIAESLQPKKVLNFRQRASA